MKYFMLVGDGMADRKIIDRGRKTPLQLANTPNMDRLAREGQCGMVKTLPPGLPRGSDVATMSLLGYNPAEFYTGRGPLEALNLGIELKAGESAFRCNLVSVGGNKLIDYSAGHISSQEAKILIEAIEKDLGGGQFSFYPGLSYRHIMVSRKNSGIFAKDLKSTPPHDIIGSAVEKNLPKGKNAVLLKKLMEKSYDILKNHPVNTRREKKGQNPANMIWLWGQGEKPKMPSFYEKYGKYGTVISAVDIVKGIGKAIGMDTVNVKGATGFLDTNYRGKVNAALRAIKEKDLVLIHIEATDEASHIGDVDLKIKALEQFDKKVVGCILKHVSKNRNNYKVFLGCDHATPVALKTHTDEAVPFVIWGGGKKDACSSYDEIAIAPSPLYFEDGYKLMGYFLK